VNPLHLWHRCLSLLMRDLSLKPLRHFCHTLTALFQFFCFRHSKTLAKFLSILYKIRVLSRSDFPDRHSKDTRKKKFPHKEAFTFIAFNIGFTRLMLSFAFSHTVPSAIIPKYSSMELPHSRNNRPHQVDLFTSLALCLLACSCDISIILFVIGTRAF